MSNIFLSLPTKVADAITTVATAADLPAGVPVGSIRYVEDTDTLYTYDGAAWHTSSVDPDTVIGPGSTTDNALVRWDGTTGMAAQNSTVIVSDGGDLTGVTSINTITSTEIGYLDNVTSSIQTQLNAKVATTSVGVAGGVASLDGSAKIPQIQLPAIAITNTFVVASQVAMLALTAETGDVAVRTDLSKSYILAGTDPTVLGDWQELLTPTDTVLSVNGQTGSVVLGYGDITTGVVPPANGGTGVANNAAATLTRSGNHALTLTTTGTTNVTLPTSGILATSLQTAFAGGDTITTGDYVLDVGSAVAGLTVTANDTTGAADRPAAIWAAATASGSGTAAVGVLATSATTAGITPYVTGGAAAVVAGALAGDPAIIAYQELGSSGAALSLQNSTNFDTMTVNLSAPPVPGVGDVTYGLVLPDAQGAANTFMRNNGSGTLSWTKAVLTTDVSGILPAANGGTGQNSTATFPTSGVVVTEAGSQTLTNKTLTAPVIATITNTGTLTLPTSTDTLVGRATTDTLTNKTLTAPVITSAALSTTNTVTLLDTGFEIRDNSDPTKRFVFDATNVSASTTRTFGVPNADTTLVGTNASQTLTSKTIDGNSNTLTVLAATQLSGATPIANGGTGQITKAAGYDALSPMTTAGDIVYGGASGTGTRLAAGVAGQRLRSAGATTPVWGWNSTNSTSAAYTVTDTDGYHVVKLTGSTARTFTLPAAANNSSRPITFVNVSTAILTIARAGSDTIGPGSETALTLALPGDSVTLQSDGSASWDFIGEYYQSYKNTAVNIASGGGTGGTYAVYATRVGRQVQVTINWAIGTGSPGNSVDSQSAELPAWARPANTVLAWNNLSSSTFTVVQASTTGLLSGFSRQVATSIATLAYTVSTTYTNTISYVKFD
jgi:hypothetical protein